MKQLYVAWIRFQRRPVSMQKHFGYELRFFPTMQITNPIVKAALSYPVQAVLTVAYILKMRPRVFWIQAPPNILLHIAWIIRFFHFGSLMVVADLHNSAFSKLWFSLPFTKSILNSFDAVLVHNEQVYSNAVKIGIDENVLFVLEDMVPDFDVGQDAVLPGGRPYFLAPCSFGKDEPIFEILDAARLSPEFDIRITGDVARAQALGLLEKKPQNVEFVGYLPVAEFERVMANAAGVLCLTKHDGVQLSSAIEAIAAKRPMIMSDMPLLRTLFSTALFTRNTPEALASAFKDVVANFALHAAQTRRLSMDEDRRERWNRQAAKLTERLNHGFRRSA